MYEINSVSMPVIYTKRNMINKNKKPITIFEGQKIRRHWDEQKEKWYFSVVDIIQILTEQTDYQLARNYWKVLKNRLKKEGSEVVTKCNRLKMEAEDGKSRDTDVADVETILRLIQSIPSKKAEPIKIWLARATEKTRENLDKQKSRISAGYLRDLSVALKPSLLSATSIIV